MDYKLEIDILPNYIFGGRANFIIKEISNNNHIEFKISKDPKNSNIYFVRYKSLEWKYIGILDKEKLKFFPIIDPARGASDQIEKGAIFYRLMIYILQLKKLPLNLEAYFTGECSVCGRKLTDPKYIKIGIGPTCLNK